MFGLIAFISFTTFVLGAPNGISQPEGRIIGGNDADIEDFPYQLSINDEGVGVLCGAVLISSRWALTSGVCADYAENIQTYVNGSIFVRSNSSNITEGVKTTIEQFVTINDDNNIALVQLATPIECTYCTPISLSSTAPQSGDVATISGWGWSKKGDIYYLPTELQTIEVPVIDSIVCKNAYANVMFVDITENVFCVDGKVKGATRLDDGGPVVIDGSLAGIIVLSIYDYQQYPTVVTNIVKYLDWITKHTGIKVNVTVY